MKCEHEWKFYGWYSAINYGIWIKERKFQRMRPLISCRFCSATRVTPAQWIL